MSSWYWRREYEFSFSGNTYKASNDLQKIRCPSCGAEVHGQYTHTWKNRDFPIDFLGDFDEVNYHHNLETTPGFLETLAFFYRKPPEAGFFPDGPKVFYLERTSLPADLDARWPRFNIGEIAAHGREVGRLVHEGPLP